MCLVLETFGHFKYNKKSKSIEGFLKCKNDIKFQNVLFCRSIRHLTEAANADGKAALSLNKLKLFRQFYIMVRF